MQVLVLGGGYAGLAAARRLARSLPDEAELTLVDESETHLVQHELHRVVRRPSLADEIAVPFESVLPDRVSFVRGRVRSIDRDRRIVELDDGRSLGYDVGAVCLGAETADYGLAGVAEHGLPLKRLAHARSIREAALAAFDGGERVVVGGAGLSGVQVAGELAAFAREEAAESELLLVEREPEVAPGFDEPFRRAVHDALLGQGVAVRTGVRIAEATADAVRTESGETIAHGAFVWTGGIRGSDALDGERPRVRSTLSLGDDLVVAGDAARIVDDDGRAVPAAAQSAVRSARVAAANVERLVAHRLDGGGGFSPRLDRFAFDSPGWIVSVGTDAVAQIGGQVLTGRPAIAAKATLGVGYLSSVGAVRNAVDLVNEELDLAVDAN